MPAELRVIPGQQGLVGLTTSTLSESEVASLFAKHQSAESPLIVMGDFEFSPELAPVHQRSDEALRTLIRQVIDSLRTVTSRCDLTAVEAGLFLMHDCLDESHTCSQSIEGEGVHRNGDYWHAIMHRREPDFGNSKYWFRRVGQHPIFKLLTKMADRMITRSESVELQSLTANGWNPMLFVDYCERYAEHEASPTSLLLRKIQGWEMTLLLKQSIIDAVGATPHNI